MEGAARQYVLSDILTNAGFGPAPYIRRLAVGRRARCPEPGA